MATPQRIPLFTPTSRATFIRFCFVGVVAFCVDTGILYFSFMVLGFDKITSRLLSYLVAATCAWYLNRRFTFRQARASAHTRQWLSYLVVNSVGGTINYFSFVALILLSETVDSYPIIGVAVGTGLGLIFNYTLSSILVFRSDPPVGSSPDRK